jgi:catalase
MDFISNQHRHGETLLALGASRALFEQAGVAVTLPGGKKDPGLFVASAAKAGGAVLEFIEALGKHRHPERELAAAAR